MRGFRQRNSHFCRYAQAYLLRGTFSLQRLVIDASPFLFRDKALP